MRTIVVALSLALSSCVLYPTVPTHTLDQLADKGATKPLSSFTLEDTRNMVRGLRIVLDEAAMGRRRADTTLREISFYGTLVLVGGTLEKSVAARNIGGGSAGLASVFSDHYGIKAQRSAFTRAARHAGCIEDAIRPIAPDVRALFDESFDGNTELAEKYHALQSVTSVAINKVRSDLAAELDGVVLGAPSVTEVAGIFDKLSKEREDVNKSAPPAANLKSAEAKLPLKSRSMKSTCEGGEKAMIANLLSCEEREKLLAEKILEQQDQKKQFIIAVGTYAETVAACSVTKQ